MRKLLLVVALTFPCFPPGLGADTSITVYNQNLGLVRDTREIVLDKGTQHIAFTDVAGHINPASVSFSLPRFPGQLTVREQNFDYDLVSREKLLQKYIGKDIEIERRDDKGTRGVPVRGKLLAAADGLIVQTDDRILINPAGELSVARLPEGLMLQPTLSCSVDSQVSGKQTLEIRYLTDGMNWNADYVAVSAADDGSIDLTGWVTVTNQSGATFRDAQLKMVAGDVHRVQPEIQPVMRMYAKGIRADAAEPSFQEQSLFEYHLYSLNRRTTLRDRETKQIEFISAANVPVKKMYRYDGAATGGERHAVATVLQFRNAKDRNLGMPLPKGTVRIYKRDGDGSLEFIGEDAIAHTPQDEDVTVYLGDAFDIVGERKQTSYRTAGQSAEESFSITLRNHKKDAVAVRVVERFFRWSNWKITEHSDEFTKDDSRTGHFLVTVPADGEKTVTYTVKYWW
jgi:hypothetical protein